MEKCTISPNNKETLQGVLIIIAGLALLLHTLGIIEKGINLILIVLSIVLIGYGIYKTNIYGFIMCYMKKEKTVAKSENKSNQEEE
jgi:type IV secretory pathway VirB3-like protein